MFKNTYGFNRVKGMLPPGCHIEAARGTRAQNYTYCTKNDTEHQRWPDTSPVSFFSDEDMFIFHFMWFQVDMTHYKS